MSKKLTTQIWMGSHKKKSFQDYIEEEQIKRRNEVRSGYCSRRFPGSVVQKTRKTSNKRRSHQMAESVLKSDTYMSTVLTGNVDTCGLGLIIEKRQRMPLIKPRDMSLIVK